MRKISWVINELRAEWRGMSAYHKGLEIARWIVLACFAFVVFAMMGCAPMTEAQREEVEYRNAETREAWLICQHAWKQRGLIWYTSRTRSAMDSKLGREPHPMDMRREMAQNGCQVRL